MLFGSRLNKLSATVKKTIAIFVGFKTSTGNNFVTSDGDTLKVRE